MSYQEIIAALQAGEKVCWKNKGYKVLVQNNQLYSIFIHNDSMCMLQESEYKDCFVGSI